MVGIDLGLLTAKYTMELSHRVLAGLVVGLC